MSGAKTENPAWRGVQRHLGGEVSLFGIWKWRAKRYHRANFLCEISEFGGQRRVVTQAPKIRMNELR